MRGRLWEGRGGLELADVAQNLSRTPTPLARTHPDTHTHTAMHIQTLCLTEFQEKSQATFLNTKAAVDSVHWDNLMKY